MHEIILTIPNNSKDVADLLKTVDVFLDQKRLSSRIVTAIEIVIEECLMNAIRHGYEDESERAMTVGLSVKSDEVAIRIENDASEFNPLTEPRLEIDASPPENGKGLGLHLIRNMTNAITYSRENGKNILEIWIFFEIPPP